MTLLRKHEMRRSDSSLLAKQSVLLEIMVCVKNFVTKELVLFLLANPISYIHPRIFFRFILRTPEDNKRLRHDEQRAVTSFRVGFLHLYTTHYADKVNTSLSVIESYNFLFEAHSVESANQGAYYWK